jgi:Domain of unknown function (DUF6436)
MQRKTRNFLSTALFALWLALIAIAYWYAEVQWWRPFVADELAIFNGETLHELPPALANSGKVIVIHFLDDDCPCTRFTRSHLDALQGKLNNTRQFVLRRNSGKAPYKPQASAMAVLPAAYALTLHPYIPASPAVGIWDAHGRLAYFGPYTSGPVCGTGTSFVETALQVLKRGENPGLINTDATGCFCAWGKKP